MIVIHWNISYNSNVELIYEELKKHTKDSFVCVLLEVLPSKKDKLLDLFGNDTNYVYSLDYRMPGKFDGKNRQLGVLLLTSKGINIEESGVFERSLFPDRTIWARVSNREKKLTVVGLHSLTGCDYKKAKSANFISYLEGIDTLNPDIITIDANEPLVDHYNIEEMKFFDKNGDGAYMFFNGIKNQGYYDSYVTHYDKTNFIYGKPLTISHIVKTRSKNPKSRYDFIFLKDKIKTKSVVYDYDDAIKATADHAILIADINMNSF